MALPIPDMVSHTASVMSTISVPDGPCNVVPMFESHVHITLPIPSMMPQVAVPR